MESFIDEILVFLGLATLTSGEVAMIDQSLLPDYTIETYTNIVSIIESRQLVNDSVSRLASLYKSKGVEVEQKDYTPYSNIFIGAKL